MIYLLHPLSCHSNFFQRRVLRFLYETMQKNHAPLLQTTKENTPNAVVASGSDLKKTMTKRFGVGQPQMWATQLHLHRDANKACQDA
jgi:hypothetical protein